MSDRVQKLLKKHQNEIQNRAFLPLFIVALVEGGVKLLDEVRDVLEETGLDLTNADFSRLK